ncbi:MAG: response regulator [Clostridium baratii]|uniref:Stage 0 sporulation protein A homolog n=1 Tax=Clostridium baratii str. Sullivan TaxID=1415775 RepID=A0A0A7FTT0_9CLOT|nr:response regulator [Clostridium baratii]AIY83049.1 response regulator [Clostridium baratii str. Sullivan]MBS6006310.1 response regulator [Clostridium baratii]MDU1054014.1 response regulator [Clostridium baratii]MDU4912621.1 response regulator [Clostridium baratii]CUO86592.1 response regulator with CheY-like receiver%2C AAA-type ATPase%2C and DNA-binding domains [Clostridium baratii]
MRQALVVDDTKNIRLLLSKCLENENFNVFQASNAMDALDLIYNNNFDIAFIDIKMPNMSGTSLLKTIRSKGYSFPVVVMTAFGTVNNAVTTTKLGARAYLQKPFTSNTIKKTLTELFSEDSSLSIEEIENNISFDSSLKEIKEKLLKNPLLPETYAELGNILIQSGNTDKGLLFKKFSKDLSNIN